MSNIRRPSSNRIPRRRLEIELLEGRDCPTVTFGFEAGILRVTGDDGPNRIEIFQPRDRAVEVIGDGVHRTFEGVDEIRVDAKGGHDEAHSSKPKEIVVVGSKLKINAGPGNDRITIDDGGPTATPMLHNSRFAVEVDLGTGSDELNVQLHHHDDIDLKLKANDGNDHILVGMLLPAIQKVRAAAARTHMQLPGGGNTVAVSAENIDNLALTLNAPNARSQGDVITIKGAGFGNNHDHPDFAWFPTRMTTSVKLGSGHDRLTLNTEGIHNVINDIDSGAGDDVVKGGAVRVCTGCVYKAKSSINLGAGNDQLTYDFQGIDEVNSFISAGAGNDTVDTTGNLITFYDLSNYIGVVQLGAGNDTYNLKTEGYREIRDSINTGPAGNGRDKVNVDHQSLRQTTPVHQRRLALDSGKDIVDLLGIGYGLQLKKSLISVEFLFVA